MAAIEKQTFNLIAYSRRQRSFILFVLKNRHFLLVATRNEAYG